MYKMLVLDVDDTLLNSKKELTKEVKTSLIEIQKRGVKVVLASGRPTGGMITFAKELKLDEFDSYIISFNGGEIVSVKTGEVLYEKSLSKENTHELYKYSKECDCAIITYKNNDILGEDYTEYVKIEEEITGLPFKKLNSFIEIVNFDPIKCIVLQEPSYLKKVEEKFKAKFPDNAITISKPFFLEITAHNVDKGHTLKFLADKLNIDISEVVAVGNAENDLSMIQTAGLGAWVQNTDKSLWKYGDFVATKSSDENGVCEIIEKFF